MAPFLVIQLRPEDEVADQELEAISKHGGLADHEIERLQIDRVELPKIDLAHYSAIIVGGSPFDISTDKAKKSKLQLRVEANFETLFDKVVALDFPFLGACSGNGLLGSYCGAAITRRFAEPVGAIDVEMTQAGFGDPLLTDFPERFRVLVGHKEACDAIPPGATLLVKGEACPVQMFRVGQHVYATQFHPEGDAEGFQARIRAYKTHGYFDPEDAETLIEALNCEKTPWGHKVLHRFVKRYRRPAQ